MEPVNLVNGIAKMFCLYGLNCYLCPQKLSCLYVDMIFEVQLKNLLKSGPGKQSDFGRFIFFSPI